MVTAAARRDKISLFADLTPASALDGLRRGERRSRRASSVAAAVWAAREALGEGVAHASHSEAACTLAL